MASIRKLAENSYQVSWYDDLSIRHRKVLGKIDAENLLKSLTTYKIAKFTPPKDSADYLLFTFTNSNGLRGSIRADLVSHIEEEESFCNVFTLCYDSPVKSTDSFDVLNKKLLSIAKHEMASGIQNNKNGSEPF